MQISKIKIAFKYLFGGMGSVVDYLLDVLNAAMDNINVGDKAKIQGVLNVAERVAATLRTLQWLCPTKWQTAYEKTLDAVSGVIAALADLNLTLDELSGVKATFAAAVAAWKSPDDETCVG